MEKVIDGYIWKEISSFCPEQWEIFNKNGKQIAYVRERWSNLVVFCPNVNGELVLELGCNEHKQEVMSFKDEILNAIIKWKNGEENIDKYD